MIKVEYSKMTSFHLYTLEFYDENSNTTADCIFLKNLIFSLCWPSSYISDHRAITYIFPF